jgi:hypothetical protein
VPRHHPRGDVGHRQQPPPWLVGREQRDADAAAETRNRGRGDQPEPDLHDARRHQAETVEHEDDAGNERRDGDSGPDQRDQRQKRMSEAGAG